MQFAPHHRFYHGGWGRFRWWLHYEPRGRWHLAHWHIHYGFFWYKSVRIGWLIHQKVK